MSVVSIVDQVTAWVREEVCNSVRLKAPPKDERGPVDGDYSYELVTPAAFSLFVPTEDKLPPGAVNVPSVCVRLASGAEDRSGGSLGLELCFSAWDPGLHVRDVFSPENGNWRPDSGTGFQRDGGGWRDVWNFVDTALGRLRNTETLGGVLLDRSVPIKYGPMTEQGAIVDFYPYWFAWITFTVRYPVQRNVGRAQDFL